MTSWHWEIMQQGHPSWSDFKAKPHKPHSCFICLPSHWACTLKASLIPCVSWWKTMPNFLQGSLFNICNFFPNTQSKICQLVGTFPESVTALKVYSVFWAWDAPVAIKPPPPPVLAAKYTQDALWTIASVMLRLTHRVTWNHTEVTTHRFSGITEIDCKLPKLLVRNKI